MAGDQGLLRYFAASMNLALGPFTVVTVTRPCGYPPHMFDSPCKVIDQRLG
jgi:hypothetical protein